MQAIPVRSAVMAVALSAACFSSALGDVRILYSFVKTPLMSPPKLQACGKNVTSTRVGAPFPQFRQERHKLCLLQPASSSCPPSKKDPNDSLFFDASQVLTEAGRWSSSLYKARPLDAMLPRMEAVIFVTAGDVPGRQARCRIRSGCRPSCPVTDPLVR